MASCPNCLSELRTGPDAVARGLAAIVAAGGHLPRPAGTAAFADGPACTLVRLSARGSLAFIGNHGLREATVYGPSGQALPPLVCRDLDDSVLFRLVAYEALAAAVVALDAGGAPLATFVRAAAGLDVRDETSAPAARLHRVDHEFVLTETGGRTLARVGSSDYEAEGWIDDQWWLQPTAGVRLPLKPLAAVALVLAAKVLLGRAAPIRRSQRPDDDTDESTAWGIS